MAWLALDEQERIHLAEAHTERPPSNSRVKAHAVFHAIVENQVAERLESVVRAMDRFMNEGLARHDA
jgi:hypothetical protein